MGKRTRAIIVAVLAALIWLPRSGHAFTGIAYDNSAEITTVNGDTNTGDSAAYTVTGTNPVLFVIVGIPYASDFLTGVTYNSVALTRVGAVSDGVSGNTVYLYVLSAPSTGAQTLTTTFSTLVKHVTFAASYTGAATFTGSALDNSATNTATGTSSITSSLTPVADSCWIIIAGQSGFTNSIAASTGVYSRTADNTGGQAWIAGDGNGPISPAASTSMTLTSSGADSLATIMASFAPSGGGGGATFPSAIIHNPIGGGS